LTAVMNDPRIAAIQELAEPILAEQSVELVELTCRPYNHQLHIKLLVDAVGGVTIQQCARVNQRIGLALDEAKIMEEGYTIEVSSPGLDRPMATLRDYERAVGEQVQLNVEQSAEGSMNKKMETVKGMLLAVQPEAVVIKTSSGNLTVPLAQIRLAKKALPW